MNLIIFGPQGSGKGTQADIISEKLNIPHITMGELLRAEVKLQSELGKKIEDIINQGNLVSDEITLDLLKNHLSLLDNKNGFIIDGYPRNLNQAKLLAEISNIDKALEIWISDEESIKRISGRRSCSKCGTVFHLQFNPSKEENKCDKCGTELVIREDDKKEVIKKRLEIYHQQTEEVIGYYKERGVHLKINGMPSIAEVTNEIINKLK